MEISKFENLSDEILLKIFYNHSISEEDLISFSNVCKRFQNVCCAEDKLWKSKFIQRWPLVWKKIDSGNRLSTWDQNWKRNVEISVNTSNEIENILSSISYKSYEFKSIPSFVLSSVYKLLDSGKLASFIVLDELLRERTNLTHRYYANQLFYHAKYYLFSTEIKKFFHLPPERQTLEKGVYYVAKGIQPDDYQVTNYEEVSFKLDKLALEIQSYLRTINPNHPAVSIELFSPEDPFENSKWSDEETYELIECLNHILCSKNTLRGNDNIQSIFWNKITEQTREGIDYFSFIYIAVSHRLGIALQKTCFHGKFQFKWKPSQSESFEVFHPYLNANFPDFDVIRNFLISEQPCSTTSALLILARSSEYTIWKSETDMNLFPKKIATYGIILLLLYYFGQSFDILSSDEINFCLKHELHLECISEIYEKFGNRICGVENLRDAQRKLPRVITPKIRAEGDDIKFATGLIVTYKRILKPGVVLGWDKKYSPEIGLEHVYNVSSLKYKFDQPFYRVLFEDEVTHYAPQELLSVEMEPVPIMHFEIGKYFKRFNGTFYEPNKELCSEFPDEEKIRSKFISILNLDLNLGI